MIEKILFSDLASLQEKASATLSKLNTGSALGADSLRVITDDIKQQLAEADELGASAQAVDRAVEPTREDLRTAFKICNDLIVDREVEDITERAKDLALKAPLLDKATLSQRVLEIRSLIFHVMENESLTNENRQYIRFAQKLLESAQNPDRVENPSLSNRSVEHLPSSSVVSVDFTSHVLTNTDPEMAIELCHIAHCFYDTKFEKAEALRKDLSPFHHARINHYLDTLQVSLLDLDRTDESDEQIEVLVKVVRAHVACANEFAGNAHIPDEDEVIAMFEGFELP